MAEAAQTRSAGSDLPSLAAVIGAGVIGSGWAARLRLRGVDVRAYDPAPEAAAVLAEVHDNAGRAWVELGLPVDRPGSLTICDSIEEAVADAELIQESVPERLEVKLATLSVIDRAAPAAGLIASSTSGFKPTVLAPALAHPERLVVAHPFNPVYLLPLVEIVGGEATSAATVERALALYRGLGMHPLHVRVEIDAFIADRLLEAVWREALWLIDGGVATTAEIDDAIRYGFGLRWAQMGLFETYRIAGGLGGMRQFIAQFGEALAWPWSRLTDTPELSDELVDRIARQSDDQSGHHGIRELERLRDRNLAVILRALESVDWGAGRNLAALRAASSGPSADVTADGSPAGTVTPTDAPGRTVPTVPTADPPTAGRPPTDQSTDTTIAGMPLDAVPLDRMPLDRMPLDELVAATHQVLAAKAVSEFDPPIRLASGQLSRFFVDGKAGLAQAADLRLASQAMHALVTAAGIDYDAVGGLTMGADHLAVGVALAADRSWFFVRKEAKDRGTGRQIEGATLGAGSRVLVVEDVVSTGGSLFKAIDVIQAAGATVVAASTLIDRGGGAGDILAQRGIPYFPVARHDDLGLPPVASAASLSQP